MGYAYGMHMECISYAYRMHIVCISHENIIENHEIMQQLSPNQIQLKKNYELELAGSKKAPKTPPQRSELDFILRGFICYLHIRNNGQKRCANPTLKFQLGERGWGLSWISSLWGSSRQRSQFTWLPVHSRGTCRISAVRVASCEPTSSQQFPSIVPRSRLSISSSPALPTITEFSRFAPRCSPPHALVSQLFQHVSQ